VGEVVALRLLLPLPPPQREAREEPLRMQEGVGPAAAEEKAGR